MLLYNALDLSTGTCTPCDSILEGNFLGSVWDQWPFGIVSILCSYRFVDVLLVRKASVIIVLSTCHILLLKKLI